MNGRKGSPESPLMECVPNASEGRNRDLIEALARAIRAVSGVRLLDIHADPDHHRSVFTFVGAPAAVEVAALALAEAALQGIDMRTHHGIHPRLGALDVLPFVPVRGITMAEAVSTAHRVGQALGTRLHLPVFFYAEAALSPERRQLPTIRRGEYEGLRERLRDPSWQPDAGPAHFNARSGATAVGARRILVAFNVWLDSDNVGAAQEIARSVRESAGGLPGVQAMGVLLARRGIAQVAMNLLDYRAASLPRVFERVKREAAARGLAIRQTELVGLAPQAAFEDVPPDRIGLIDFTPEKYLDTHLPPA